MRRTVQPKVARVVTRMNIGGPSHHVTILSTRRVGEYRTVLLSGGCGPREGSMFGTALRAGADVRVVPGLQRKIAPFADVRALVWLYRFFRQERPLIEATHTAKAGTVGRIAAILARVPVRVHTFHGHVLEGYFGAAMTLAFRTVERLLGRFTTHFVAISPLVAKDLDALGICARKISVIPLGLDLKAFTDGTCGALRSELGVTPAQPLIGIVGRLVPIKAHDLFLKAALNVRRRWPEARFIIVGDGELWNPLHGRVVDLGLEESVVFLGWRQDLDRVYQDLDCVVCCSLNEGTPVSLIEAGAAGRPVVATSVGGVPDVVIHEITGLLVPTGDAEALAEAIMSIMADPKAAAKMGYAGRKRALAVYDSNAMVEKVGALYDRLVSEACVEN